MREYVVVWLSVRVKLLNHKHDMCCAHAPVSFVAVDIVHMFLRDGAVIA